VGGKRKRNNTVTHDSVFLGEKANPPMELVGQMEKKKKNTKRKPICNDLGGQKKDARHDILRRPEEHKLSHVYWEGG